MVTDEGENSSPPFLTTLKKYREELKTDPHVVFVKVGNAVDELERKCERNGISYDAHTFQGDYYSLPNLIQYLTQALRAWTYCWKS